MGVVNGYRTAMSKLKTNDLIDKLNTVVVNTKSTYSSQRNYKGLSNGLVALVGILPRDMYEGNGETWNSNMPVTNSFSGNFVIESAAANDNEFGAFILAVDSIPSSVCFKLVTANWSSESDSDLQAIYVNSAEGNNVYDAIDSDQIKPSIIQPTSVSDQGGTGSSNASYVNVGGLISPQDAVSICGESSKVTIAWKFI